MKRRRTMLLAVTATSVAAVIACTPDPDRQPVGKVAPHDFHPEPSVDAAADDAGDGAVPLPGDATPTPDASVAPPKPKADGGKPLAMPPDFHPDRVGTTANVDDVSPTVGTTAHVPDKKK